MNDPADRTGVEKAWKNGVLARPHRSSKGADF